MVSNGDASCGPVSAISRIIDGSMITPYSAMKYPQTAAATRSTPPAALSGRSPGTRASNVVSVQTTSTKIVITIAPR